MIAHLRGRLLAKYPQQAILEAGGVGYDVVISISTFTALPAEGAEVALFIHTHVREDTLALYGFLDRNDKRVFERLITVSGVGPKLAVTIQSGLSTERLIGAIRGQDHATLSQIPGIGKRLAERLVVDLKDKLEDLAAAPPAVETGPSTDDVLSALVNLGYQRPLAQKAIAAAVAKDKSVKENFEKLFRGALAAMRN
ncbi:MAG: Holliday junction branch migration protein RuvA [Acidobacteriaceae bacterium]